MSAQWFHVMNRAAPGRRLVRSARDARALLDLVETHCVGGGVEIHAYCLLDLHYHLLARAESGGLLEAIAQFEAGAEPGLFPPGMARVLRVSLGRHLAVVSRYIHLNPVLAGLVWSPEAWPHSSLRAYLGDPRAPAWVRTTAVLGQFGSSGARHRYRAFVLAGLDPGARDDAGRPRWGTAFVRGSMDEELAWRIDPFLVQQDSGPASEVATGSTLSLTSLARALADAFSVEPDAIRFWRKGGGSRAALARGALVTAARRSGTYRLREVAAWMRYASPATAVIAAARFERAARADAELARKIDDALRRLGTRATPLKGRTEP